MTREEEIQRKAGELADFGISNYQPNQQQYYEGFIDGAKWADQNPQKGLWDVEKVIKWLKDNSKKYVVCYEDGYSHYAHNSLVEDLRKAMENKL